VTRYYSAIAVDNTLASAITSSSTSMILNVSPVGYPTTYPFVLAVDYNAAAEELVLVTAASGTTLTISRGFNGTSAQSHAVGAVIRHVITAQDLTDAATHQAASSGVHGVLGSVVGTTDTQVLTNKDLTSSTNTFPSTLGNTFTINAQTGTTYTLVSGDVNKLVTLSNASAITLTIPSVTFTTGQQINIQQIGAGQVTVQGDGTSTFTGTGTKLRAQYSAATIVCTASNTFTLIGDLA
jgi:hypothetical protein